MDSKPSSSIKGHLTGISDPGDLPLHVLGAPLRSQVDWLQRRHGLSPVGASLAALSGLLCATGPSRRILNPLDLSFLPPAMSLVLIGSPALHVRAAVNLGLDPLRQWMLHHLGEAGVVGSRRARLRIGELHEQLTQKDFLLRNAVQPMRPGIDPNLALEKELEANRRKFILEREAIIRRIHEESFRLAPSFLCDDASLRRLLDPIRLAHDAAVLAVSTSGHAATAWSRASRAEKAAFARLLITSWRGLPCAGGEVPSHPLLSSLTVTDPAGARTLHGDPELAVTGVVDELFFVPTLEPGVVADLDAACDSEVIEQSITSLQALITARVGGIRVDHQFSAEAVRRFQGFLDTSMGAAEADESSAARWEQAPALCLKLALLVHVGSPDRDEQEIGTDAVEFAAALATAICQNTIDFTRARQDALVPARTDEAEVEALVNKLRLRGPLRWRQMLRGRRDQKTDVLVALLDKAITAGRIRRDNDLYHAVETGP